MTCPHGRQGGAEGCRARCVTPRTFPSPPLLSSSYSLAFVRAGSPHDVLFLVPTILRRGTNEIQQLNYKISVILNSDARSDVEGLRWVLIRRSVLGIVFMAVLMLGSLRYGSYLSHERAKESERQAKEAAESRHAQQDAGSGRADNSLAPAAVEIPRRELDVVVNRTLGV